MRFFRPALSPFVFLIEGMPINYIHLSDDLSMLKMAFRKSKAATAKVSRSLKKDIDASPITAEVKVNKSHIQVSGLYDVNTELSETSNQISAKNPGFFTELAIYEKSLQSNMPDNPLNLDDFMDSPFHLFYFNLQGIRRDGVQHTMEFPLRFLATNGLLSRADLTKIVTKLWLETNAVRNKRAAASATLPTTTNFTPYVFRTP